MRSNFPPSHIHRIRCRHGIVLFPPTDRLGRERARMGLYVSAVPREFFLRAGLTAGRALGALRCDASLLARVAVTLVFFFLSLRFERSATSAPAAPQSYTEVFATRPFASNFTPSLESNALLRLTGEVVSPQDPANPPRVKSDAITRCHGISEQSNGFFLMADPIARAHVPTCFATSP